MNTVFKALADPTRALAKAMDAPLLCKGSDFPSTDIGIV
jgi:uncharacterized protein with PIN domain